MIRNLHESIIDYDLNMLRSIARARGFELVAARRTPAVDELESHLCNQEAVDWAWSRLPEESRQALETLLRAGGRMKAHVFSDRFGTPRTFGPGRLEREKPWLEPQSPAERLWFMGLIFFTFQAVSTDHRAEFVYVPSDVVPLLPAVDVVIPRFEVVPIETPPVESVQGSSLADTMFTILCRLQAGPLHAGKEGEPVADAFRQLERREDPQHEPDTPQTVSGGRRLEFVLHLAESAKLVHTHRGQWRPNPDTAREWLKSSRDRQLYQLQQIWRNDPAWNELRHVPELLVEDTGWKNDPCLARQAVLNHLSGCSTDACPLGTWLSVKSLLLAIKTIDPDFARPDGDYRSWYIRDQSSGEYLMDFAHWDDVEGRLIAHLLSEPLHWLGIVDLGYDRGVLTAFRIASEGEAVLEKAVPPAAGDCPPATLEVHPDFSIHFESDARLYELFQAHRFAKLSRETGQGTVFQITQGSLSEAHEQGITPQMIIVFLQQNSTEPLPQNVVNALRQRNTN